MKNLSVFAVLGILILFYILAPQARGVFEMPSDNPEQSEESYIPNQILVKFKQNEDPIQLSNIVQKRTAQRQTFFGMISLFFSDLSIKAQKQTLPEKKLTRLQSVENKVGIVQSELVSIEKDKKGQPTASLYQFTLEGKVDVAEAVRLYEKLDGVEYAEPNYIYLTM